MKYNIELLEDECNFIIGALQYLKSKNLRNAILEVRSMTYKKVKGFYADEQSFIDDMKCKEKFINEQIQEIEEIIEKLENQMEGEVKNGK